MKKETIENIVRHAKGIIAAVDMERGIAILKHEDLGLGADGIYRDKFELANGETVICEEPSPTDSFIRMESVAQQLEKHGVTRQNIDFYCWQKERFQKDSFTLKELYIK